MVALNLVTGNKTKLTISATPNEADNTWTILEFVELSKVIGLPPFFTSCIVNGRPIPSRRLNRGPLKLNYKKIWYRLVSFRSYFSSSIWTWSSDRNLLYAKTKVDFFPPLKNNFFLWVIGVAEIIRELKSHMIPYKFKCSHWLKLQHSDLRANFHQWDHLNL